jgi:predicted Rossmann fold nucleotide-binding protein DprA/Smf involved in DNA uptake
MFRYANRIVAAISLGVAVLQGAEYSGSLMTARLGWRLAAKSMAFRVLLQPS